MQIIISGGSGMIGRALTDALTRNNHEVIILSRSPQDVSRLPQGARAVRWNGSTAGAWQKELEGSDAVVNLAGASIAGNGLLPQRWSADRKKIILESRRTSGRMLSETILRLKQPPAFFLQASAVGYYGTRGDEFIYESHEPGEGFLADVCRKWEDSTRDLDLRLRRVVTRIGLVLNHDSGMLPLLKLPFRFYLGGPLGSGDQFMSWIHIEDLIRSMVFLMENHHADGVYNLTAPHPVTNHSFSKTLARLMHRPAAVPVPAFALRMLLGEAADLALEGQRVLPRRLLNNGFNFSFDNIEQALSDLLT